MKINKIKITITKIIELYNYKLDQFDIIKI